MSSLSSTALRRKSTSSLVQRYHDLGGGESLVGSSLSPAQRYHARHPHHPRRHRTYSTSSLAARSTSSLQREAFGASPDLSPAASFTSPGDYGGYGSSVAMSMGAPRSGHSASHMTLKHKLKKASSKRRA